MQVKMPETTTVKAMKFSSNLSSAYVVVVRCLLLLFLLLEPKG